jgi:hypothetical protein
MLLFFLFSQGRIARQQVKKNSKRNIEPLHRDQPPFQMRLLDSGSCRKRLSVIRSMPARSPPLITGVSAWDTGEPCREGRQGGDGENNAPITRPKFVHMIAKLKLPNLENR